jgi:hypothetical protein
VSSLILVAGKNTFYLPYLQMFVFSLLDESDKKFDTVQLFEEAALQTSGMSSTIVQTVNDKNRKFYFKLNQFKN